MVKFLPFLPGRRMRGGRDFNDFTAFGRKLVGYSYFHPNFLFAVCRPLASGWSFCPFRGGEIGPLRPPTTYRTGGGFGLFTRFGACFLADVLTFVRTNIYHPFAPNEPGRLRGCCRPGRNPSLFGEVGYLVVSVVGKQFLGTYS